MQHIRAEPDWHPIDTLLLPGEYFRLGPYIGHLDHQSRVDTIAGATFHRTVMEACGALEPGSPGALVVAGVDSHALSKHDAGDHLCVAWSRSGIVGIGRKVFPADGDTNVAERPFVCHAADFGRDSAMSGCQAAGRPRWALGGKGRRRPVKDGGAPAVAVGS